MEKMTINGETLGASQQNSLAVEQFLSDNDQVERIQQLNVNYTDEKDMAEIVEACFRKPNDGEKAKAMNTKQMIELIRKEFPLSQERSEHQDPSGLCDEGPGIQSHRARTRTVLRGGAS